MTDLPALQALLGEVEQYIKYQRSMDQSYGDCVPIDWLEQLAAFCRDLMTANAKDGARLDARPDRHAPYAGVHPVLYHSVMDAIERTVIVCDKQELEQIPREGREVDYAGILCAAIDAAIASTAALTPLETK